MDDRRLTLRSYRLAFELERRIHRIDRFRIPLPYGLPLAALGYGAAALGAVLLATSLPGLGTALAFLPFPFRLILLPAGAAHLLCRTGADGRPAHEVLEARAAFLLRPRRLVGLERAPRVDVPERHEVVLVPDERGPDYEAGVVRGPLRARLRQPARVTVRATKAELRQLDDRPMFRLRELEIDDRQSLVVVR